MENYKAGVWEAETPACLLRIPGCFLCQKKWLNF